MHLFSMLAAHKHANMHLVSQLEEQDRVRVVGDFGFGANLEAHERLVVAAAQRDLGQRKLQHPRVAVDTNCGGMYS